MRRTDTPELRESGRAPENGDPTSAPMAMRRWALLDASATPFYSPRLLPGGLAQATVFDTPRMSGACAGTASPEPGFGHCEDGARMTRRVAMHSPHLRTRGSWTGIREPSAEENEEIVEARSPRYHAA